MSDSLAGRLLVASPLLLDPNFERTVVLLLEHTEAGALGLVLNRPGEVVVSDPLPQWRSYAAAPPYIFTGGPVEPQAAVCLATVAGGADPAGWKRLVAGLGVLDLGAEPSWLAGAVQRLRVFAGYAGWGAGQLETEIAAGGWYAVDAAADDAFSGSPERLWGEVLRRQGPPLALLASFPADPRLN